MAQPLRKIATRTKRINIRKYLYFNGDITNDFRYIIYIKLSIKAIRKTFSLDKDSCYVLYKSNRLQFMLHSFLMIFLVNR